MYHKKTNVGKYTSQKWYDFLFKLAILLDNPSE